MMQGMMQCWQRFPVLYVIALGIVSGVMTTTSLRTFQPRNIDPPHHLCPTNLRPDLVIWNDAKRTVMLIELTCPFEENFVDAAVRKHARYHDLATMARSEGVQCSVWPIQIGSRGMIDTDSLEDLIKFLHLSGSAVSSFLVSLSSIVIRGSFSIWCSRNCPNDSTNT